MRLEEAKFYLKLSNAHLNWASDELSGRFGHRNQLGPDSWLKLKSYKRRVEATTWAAWHGHGEFPVNTDKLWAEKATQQSTRSLENTCSQNGSMKLLPSLSSSLSGFDKHKHVLIGLF